MADSLPQSLVGTEAARPWLVAALCERLELHSALRMRDELGMKGGSGATPRTREILLRLRADHSALNLIAGAIHGHRQSARFAPTPEQREGSIERYLAARALLDAIERCKALGIMNPELLDEAVKFSVVEQGWLETWPLPDSRTEDLKRWRAGLIHDLLLVLRECARLGAVPVFDTALPWKAWARIVITNALEIAGYPMPKGAMSGTIDKAQRSFMRTLEAHGHALVLRGRLQMAHLLQSLNDVRAAKAALDAYLERAPARAVVAGVVAPVTLSRLDSPDPEDTGTSIPAWSDEPDKR